MSHKVKLFVATPAYGGWLCEDYFHSMLELQTFCNQEQIPFRIQTLGMESLVTRARNKLVTQFSTHPTYIAPVMFQNCLFRDIRFNTKSINE